MFFWVSIKPPRLERGWRLGPQADLRFPPSERSSTTVTFPAPGWNGNPTLEIEGGEKGHPKRPKPRRHRHPQDHT